MRTFILVWSVIVFIAIVFRKLNIIKGFSVKNKKWLEILCWIFILPYLVYYFIFGIITYIIQIIVKIFIYMKEDFISEIMECCSMSSTYIDIVIALFKKDKKNSRTINNE